MHSVNIALLAAVAAPAVRAAALATTPLDGGLIVPMIWGQNQTGYMAEVSAGTPAQKGFVKVDTGSPTYSFLASSNPVCSKASKPCEAYGTFNNLTSR